MLILIAQMPLVFVIHEFFVVVVVVFGFCCC